MRPISMNMEQRLEPRFTAGEILPVTVLGENRTLEARVVNFSASGLGLEIPEAIAAGSAIKIQVADDLILGEVVYGREQNGCFFAGIHLDQTLRGLTELVRIVQAFEEGSETQTVNAARQRP